MATKAQRMAERITRHGQQLQAIFGVDNPDKVCRKLRQIEVKVSRATVAYCNGEIDEADCDAACDQAYEAVCALLGDRARECVMINRDPRGYALKIDDNYMRAHRLELYRDFGGYGILAPDLRID
jgi:hypothetical protein